MVTKMCLQQSLRLVVVRFVVVTFFVAILFHVRGACLLELYIGCPAHTHARAHGFWVGMGAILLFMGGHGWVCVQYYW